MSRPGRFHLDIPPVRIQVGDHRVTFVGAMFHSKSVMIEYDVDPPIHRDRGNFFGHVLLVLVVTDDAGQDGYPTCWEDFDWNSYQVGRMTTRLDRRPVRQATELRVSVHEPVMTGPHQAVAGKEVGCFTIALPKDHFAYHPSDP
jgi:hypothetical protein